MSDRLREAAEAVAAGLLIVMPTDTVYGVGTRPDEPVATARLFEAKARPADLVLPVLVPSLDAARLLASFDERAERLAVAFWPGALTIVLPRTPRTSAWSLGGDGLSIGVRLPRHRLARAVLERSGPLAVTSANRSGEPPLVTCDQLVATFGDAVAVYLCEREPLGGTASTVVDLSGPELNVVRSGAIDAARIRDVALG